MKSIAHVMTLCVASLALHLPAFALQPATGKIILSISGKVAEKNTANAAAFDLAMLEKLPQQTFTTMTPWDKKPIKFTGPLLRDVLAAAKAVETDLIDSLGEMEAATLRNLLKKAITATDPGLPKLWQAKA